MNKEQTRNKQLVSRIRRNIAELSEIMRDVEPDRYSLETLVIVAERADTAAEYAKKYLTR
jgi:hypothetical protein